MMDWLTIFRRRKLIPIFNRDTVDIMISDLMNHGIKHKNGNHVGKTIILHRIRDMQSILLNGSMYCIRSTKELFVN